MFTSLRSRLWLTYALLIGGVLCLIVIGIALYWASQNQQVIQRLQDVATRVQEQRADLLESDQPRLVNKAAQRADRLTGVRVLVISADGTLLADSRTITAPDLVIPTKLAANDKVRLLRDTSGQNWYYTTRSLDGSNVLLVASLRPVATLRLLSRETILLVGVGLLACVSALALAYGMARWVSRPLRRMSQAARLIADGQQQPIPIEGPDEVQTLARSFNEMIARVTASQQAQRDFVANVSHELKTPLTSIQGFAQAILDHTASTPADLQQAASIIYNEAERMNRLVLDLLDLTRMDSGLTEFKHAPLDMVPLLQTVAEKFTPQARQSQITLLVEIPPLPLLMGDADRLVQVFTNLVDNALKHTPAGGQVTLEARVLPDGVEVSISDTGAGIPPQELPRIFERFYQVDKSRRGGTGHGVGLGLAITHEIIQAHHGAITVKNNPDRGSIFVVKLPFTTPDSSTLVKRKSNSARRNS